MQNLKGVWVTRNKIKRIFRWICNKKFKVTIVYEYNNSLGGYKKRKYTGIIKKFKVEDCDGEYKIKFEFETGERGEEWISSSWEFASKYNPKWVVLSYNNSGPYCYFGIKIEE